MPKKCPFCGSAGVQRSAYADHEERYASFLKTPYRCKRCRERFWAVSRKVWRIGIGTLVLFVLLVVAAVMT
jgi:hypothetical protein